MAGKILLVSINRCAVPDPVFPLGLAYLNAALRQAGYDTRWHDLRVAAASLEETLAEYRPDFVALSLRNIDDVILGKEETYYGELAGLCATVRRVGRCPVIVGGSGFSIFPEQLLEMSGADFGIQGEGEQGLLELLRALRDGASIAGIPGLVFRQGDKVIANPPQLLPTQALLGPADRPAELVSQYLRDSGLINLQTQRGCAHTCCYCTYPLIEGRPHRRRPPEAVAEEMAALQAQGINYLFVVDSIFNSSHAHVTETCEAILRRNLKLRWGCFLRPQGLTAELMKLMAQAGLSHIEFGTDSFCDTVLEAYEKRFTFADVLHSNELAHREKVACCHFLICGGPGETLDTIEAGYENSRRLSGAVIMAVVGMRIYPGTSLHQRALREGVIDTTTDLLAPKYYLAPGLSAAAIVDRLRVFARQSPNWIAGEPVPGYDRLAQRIRQRGLTGPLWSYLAMLQRLGPVPAPSQL